MLWNILSQHVNMAYWVIAVGGSVCCSCGSVVYLVGYQLVSDAAMGRDRKRVVSIISDGVVDTKGGNLEYERSVRTVKHTMRC